MGRAAAAACLLALLGAACDAGGDGRSGVPSGREIHFTTSDGVRLTGELRGRGDTVVILSHMFPGDRTSWAPFAHELAEEGYRTLTFDFRGYGDSDGSRTVSQMWRDVLAAVQFARQEGAERIVLLGASMGGTASLVVAAREDVDGVVTLSAPATFRGLVAPPEALRAIEEPKLFVVAHGDRSPNATAQVLYAEARQPKRLLVVTGDEHGIPLIDGPQGEAVRTAILDFLPEAG